MKDDDEKLIPDALADALLTATAPVRPAGDAAARIKARVSDRIRGEAAAFVTVREAEDGWIETGPGNAVKVLHQDNEMMSMLVRLAPGTTYPRHYHPEDETTYVVEGETWFGDVHLVAGDFHLAPKGTTHGEVRTDTGCVLLIRKATEQ